MNEPWKSTDKTLHMIFKLLQYCNYGSNTGQFLVIAVKGHVGREGHLLYVAAGSLYCGLKKNDIFDRTKLNYAKRIWPPSRGQ